MTFVTKQNAGLLRSARSWGVLGLLLALAVTVGYGQIPVGQPQPVPIPPSLPAGEMIGDILTPFQPDSEAEAFRMAEVAVSFNFVGRGDFSGRVIAFNLEPLDAQPDPVNLVIGPEIILAQDTFSNAKASLTLTAKAPQAIYIGLVVLMEKSAVAVTYTASTTVRGVSFNLVVDNAKFVAARGGGFSFKVPEDQPQVLPPTTYKIFVESLYVQRDQRTGSSANFEGLLELRGEFSANNVTAPIWPSPTSFISASQYQTVSIKKDITTVTYNAITFSVPIMAKLREIEIGCCAGQDDLGQNSSSILLNGNPIIYQDVTVTISADNWKERSGILVVRFKAEKQ